MSAQHTKGPWSAQVDPLQMSKRFGPRMALVSTNAGDGTVCIDCTGSGTSFDESAANARLIAAAPALLEALELVLRGLDAGTVKAQPIMDMDRTAASVEIRSLASIVRAAIAAARGQA